MLASGCAPLQPPVVAHDAPALPNEPAPSWLPVDWARLEPRPNYAPELDRVQLYAPRGSRAPLVVYARYPVREARSLAAQHGGDAASWAAKYLGETLRGGVRRVIAQSEWTRPGVHGGRRIEVRGTEGEEGAPPLHGSVVVGSTAAGELVVVAALIPETGDPELVETVLNAAPF